MIGRHVAPIHESAFAGCVIIHDLDLKRVPSGDRDDFERIKLTPQRRDASGGGDEKDEGERRP
jgi:hypothetical protein